MSNQQRAHKLIVQKYGGATLATPEHVKQVARRIHNLQKTGTQVVVVVSAMGQTTNQLIELSRQVSPNPHLRELDMLLTTGERISMSLLSMALNDLGANAISFTGSQAGILTDDAHVNASIIDVKAFRVEEALKENKIVILAGFQGVSPQTKEITTLGRGGSDTSAVAMAGYLKADRCEILKDVDCIYTADPKLVSTAKPITGLRYDHLIEMTKWGAKVLHHKSVEMAQLKSVPVFVGSAADEGCPGTLITADCKIDRAIIAVNSHATVLKIHHKNLAQQEINFFGFLNKFQIAAPEILMAAEGNYYISAPKETLDLIEKINFSKSDFSLADKDLCSVSLTCNQKPDEDIKAKAMNVLAANNVQQFKLLISERNVNFILKKQEKDKAIQALHTLIN